MSFEGRDPLRSVRLNGCPSPGRWSELCEIEAGFELTVTDGKHLGADACNEQERSAILFYNEGSFSCCCPRVLIQFEVVAGNRKHVETSGRRTVDT